LTLRTTTERPVTLDIGTSTLVGHDTDKLQQLITEVLRGEYKRGRIPEHWDGHAADRIVDVLVAELACCAASPRRAA
jgi:UDP-N-acetylglucosamine 2-epimerase (non-hydrolysing)